MDSTGSDGYQGGSDGYRSNIDEPGSADSDATALETRSEEPQPAWARLGFSSFEEFIEGLEAEQARYSIFSDQTVRERIPDPNMVRGEAGELGPPPRGRAGRDRQVGIRMNAKDYGMLTEAAELYGVAPSTMARMLVRRGALAVTEREKREEFAG